MKTFTRNKYAFGLGTIGRDMLYTMISMFLTVYLTEVLNLDDRIMWWMTGVLLVARIFDAVNDPIMGILVDNTNSRFGKYKPWIAIGAIGSAIFTILLFTDLGLTGAGYVCLFAIFYVMWDITFTANDIAYWSMMPSLTTDQKEREKIGALARIFANVGLFTVVGGIVPITDALTKAFDGNKKTAYFVFVLIIAIFMVLGQCITLFGVKEAKGVFKVEEKTSSRICSWSFSKTTSFSIPSIAMVLFTIGYTTTTSFGLYFFKYAFKDEGMYGPFAIILGVSQDHSAADIPAVQQAFHQETAVYRLLDPCRPGLSAFLLLSDEHALHRSLRDTDLPRAGFHPASDAHVPDRYDRVWPVEIRQTEQLHHPLAAAFHQ